MLTTLNGMFARPKPHRINYIKENKAQVKKIRSMVNHHNSKSRFDVTKSRSSQTDILRSHSMSSTTINDRTSTSKLSSKGSMAQFTQDRRDPSISSMSLSTKHRSSHKVNNLKNQSCQTIDPRRCDQLYHEGVIKYPSNKVLQELAEIEKQKANRLDAHVKKEYFKRNKVKHKNPNLIPLPKAIKATGKGDENEPPASASEEEKEVEEVKPKEPEPELTKQKQNIPPSLTMRAAEIIRKTTEDIRMKSHQSEHHPSNKGDSKGGKKASKKLSKEEEILKTVLDPQCPPGHIPLPDAERKKTLHMLRVSHAELVREMNLMPVRTDTLRIRQKKIQLENQLNKIEEGIKVFNKSKVYVKIEE